MAKFDHYKRYAPTVPPDTCPIINRAQAYLTEAYSAANRVAKHCECDGAQELNDIPPTLDNVTDDLEGIRKANSELRDSSWYWRTSCEEASAELDKANAKIEELEQQIESLQDELKEEAA